MAPSKKIVKPKLKPKAAVVAKPKAKVSYASTTDATGKHVLVDKTKVAAYNRTVGIAKTKALIPQAYQGMVDPAAIYDQVQAQLDAANTPLEQAKTNANTQFDTNQRMNAQLTAQTQASLDQLMANANQRTAGYQGFSAQQAGAQNAEGAAGSAAAAAGLGNALNPNVLAAAQPSVDVQRAAQQAAGTQDLWNNTLMSGAQRDFFERGKGLAAVTQQSFGQGQSNALNQALNNIAAQQTQLQQSRPDLINKAAADQGNFVLQGRVADAAAGSKQFEDQTARVAATGTVRELVRNPVTGKYTYQDVPTAKTAAKGRGGSGDPKPGNITGTLTVQQQKLLAGVHSAVDSLNKKIGTSTVTTGSGAGKTTKTLTTADVFPITKGPWRDAFNRLTASEIGLTKDQAAVIATQWYGAAFQQASTPAKIRALLANRGVSTPVQQQIVTQYFPDIKNAWRLATAKPLTGKQAAYQQAKALSNQAAKYISAAKGTTKGQGVFNGQVYTLQPKLGRIKGKLAYIFQTPDGLRYALPVIAGQDPVVIGSDNSHRLRAGGVVL